MLLLICREEIARLKQGNPDMSHKEAFAAAAAHVSSAKAACCITLCNVHRESVVKLVQHVKMYIASDTCPSDH